MQFGNVVIEEGATVNTTDGGAPPAHHQRYRIAGNFTNNGTFDSLGDQINFNGATGTITTGAGSSTTFGKLKTEGGTVTLAADSEINIRGDLVTSGWTSTDQTSIINFIAGASNITWEGSATFNHMQLGTVNVNMGSLTGPDNATLRISGGLNVSGGASFDANGGAVAFNQFSGGNKTISGAGATIIVDDISFTANTTSLTAGTTLQVRGNMSITNGRFSANATSTVRFTGTGAGTHTITSNQASAQFGTFIVSNDRTLNVSPASAFDMRVASLTVNNNGALNANADTTLTFNVAGMQSIAINGTASLQDVTVDAGVTLTETPNDDNITVNGTITNNGEIRKTKPISATGAYRFGLASGNLPIGIDFLDVTTLGTLSQLEVRWIAGNHPNANPQQMTGSYWTLTPTGAGYEANLTLPHNNLTDAQVCHYTGAWACNVDTLATTDVTQEGITTLTDDWAVGSVPPADLSITKAVALEVDVDADGQYDTGDTIRYTITVTNNGPADTTGISVFDFLPVGLSYVTHNASVGNYNDGTGVWDGFGLTDTSTATLTIDAQITGAMGDSITNIAQITASSEPDPIVGNDEDSVTFTVYQPPAPTPPTTTDATGESGEAPPQEDNLANDPNAWDIQISTDTGFITQGQTITFTITVRKLIGGTPVQVNFPVPDGLSILSATSNRGAVGINGQLVTYTDDIHVGDVGITTIVTRVGANAQSGVSQACITVPVDKCTTLTLSQVLQLPATGETPPWATFLRNLFGLE